MTSTGPEAAWNTAALDHPLILDLPDRPGGDPTPLLRLGRQALARVHADLHPQASRLLAQLASRGVVALRTSTGTWEIRERLDGWILAPAVGPVDLRTLAAATRLRATRLARQRRALPPKPR
ncbi:hypothetical protein ND748_07770 [Frankia sp. AiPs1]|uniref:hypothetical protein n=1 Tax=Frankia sp. AiPs1 TaxID=573493 RepID=UPI002042CB10|nr:hypothetical protein [Frankia sp. AiPs1]MCM3921562.1 hypothetical protein [Frankia sp. AiPs1]